MGLVYKHTLEERVGSFVVIDKTGLWSPSYPYGYGFQTVRPQWVTSAICEVTPPGSNTPILVPTGVFNTTSVGDGIETQIHPWDLGMKKIESGKWKVKCTIHGTTPAGIAFCYKSVSYCVFTKEVECCVDKETAKVQTTLFNDVFRDELSRKVAMMQVVLTRTLKAVGGCGSLDLADRNITFLKLQCRCGCG